MQISSVVALVIKAIPEVIPLLKPQTLRRAFKSEIFFEVTVEHLVRQVYYGWMGGDFIDIMDSLIAGQMYDAYLSAWQDDGNTSAMPDWLDEAMKQATIDQQSFVQAFYNDIIDARVDGTPIDPLIPRAKLWGGQWNSHYQNAVVLINAHMGGKLQWHEGDTKEKCATCLALDGIVAYASEWMDAGFQPKNYPNDMLDCGGWNCGCTLDPTNQRRSPNARARLMAIAVSKLGGL